MGLFFIVAWYQYIDKGGEEILDTVSPNKSFFLTCRKEFAT